MKTLGYYNGTYDELENMMVPFDDRVCFFGDGVYDAGPARNYHLFAIDEHIDRFFNSAKLMDIEIPCSKEELKELLASLVLKWIQEIILYIGHVQEEPVSEIMYIKKDRAICGS